MNASATPRLNLPFLQAGQALKNITHNEALQRIDSGLYLSCSDMAANALPDDPTSGFTVIISKAAEHALVDRIDQIAVFVNGDWVWFTPKPGWAIWDNISQTLRVFDGQVWVSAVPNFVPDTLPLLGLNTSANPSQRLAVASHTTLFTHDGDSHRLTLNRAAPADTASVVFQTDFAGETELGLTGTGGFALRTSSDGVDFVDRLTTPNNYSGVQSPAFGSMRIILANDTAELIETPATGGIIALTVVSDNGYPSAARSGLLAYDTGNSPSLVSLATTGRIENHGSTTLDGTTSSISNIGISAVDGGLYIENRVTGSRDISLTFLC